LHEEGDAFHLIDHTFEQLDDKHEAHGHKVHKRSKHAHVHCDHHSDDEELGHAKKERKKTSRELGKQASKRLVLYITVLGSFSLVEGVIGVLHVNVHLIRDFFNSMLMLCALGFSSKALELASKAQSHAFVFGYARVNVLAAFVNACYLLFSFVFGFVDNLHHMVEHWEEESHAREAALGDPRHIRTIHDDVAHIKEMNSYLTLFTFLRLVIFAAYLYLEGRNHNVASYMRDNWLDWPPVGDKAALKAKLRQVLAWDSFRINLYSISLLVACELVSGLGNVWIYFVCANFGIVENLISLLKGAAVLAASVPLSLDICFVLLQKATPEQAVLLMEYKVRKLGYVEGVVHVKHWHLWCLDKSFRVCSMALEAREDANPDEIVRIFNKKLLNKYCEKLCLHIVQ